MIPTSVTVREFYSKRLKRKTYAYEIDILLQQQRVRESKRGFTKITDAREAGRLRELELKKKSKQGYDLQEIISKDKDKVTVSELIDIWLISKKSSVSYKTYKFYKFMSDMIKDSIGKIKVKKLKTENIEIAINKLIDDDGESSTTAGHYYTVLNIIFNWAMDRGYAIKNPCKQIKKPKATNKELHVFTQEQLNRYLNAIKHLSIFGPAAIAATTGMRLGEICGLTWENIDLDNGFIEIQKQLQKINNEFVLVPLKTKGSKRKIILLDYTINVLKDIQATQEQNKQYLGDNYKDSGFVICKNDGTPYDPEYISRDFRRILKERKHKAKINGETKYLKLYELLNLPLIRFHDLRHTHATILLQQGVNIKVVSERLGHADIRTTLTIYAHVLPSMQEEITSKLNSMFPYEYNSK